MLDPQSDIFKGYRPFSDSIGWPAYSAVAAGSTGTGTNVHPIGLYVERIVNVWFIVNKLIILLQWSAI